MAELNEQNPNEQNQNEQNLNEQNQNVQNPNGATNDNTAKSVAVKKAKATNPQKKFFVVQAILNLALTCVLFASLLTGVLTYKGNSLTVISVLTLILEIKKLFSSLWYSYLVDLVICIVFIGTFVACIKRIADAAYFLRKVLSGKFESRRDVFRYLSQNPFLSYAYLLVLQMACNMVTYNTFSDMFVYVFAFTGIVYVLNVILDYIEYTTMRKASELILRAVRSAVVITAVTTAAWVLNKSVFDGFVFGVKSLFGGNINAGGGSIRFVYNLYSYLVVFGLFAAVQFIVMKYIFYTFKMPLLSKVITYEKTNEVKIFVTIGVMFAIDIAINHLFYSEFNISMLYGEYTSAYLKVVAALVASVIACSADFAKDVPKKVGEKTAA